MTLTDRVIALADGGFQFPLIAAVLDITPAQVLEAMEGVALTGGPPEGAASLARDWRTGNIGTYAALDANYVYFATGVEGTIGRVRRDGTGLNNAWLVTGAGRAIEGLAVDSEYIYWSSDEGIGRATIDGVAPALLVAIPEGLQGLAVQGPYLYVRSEKGVARVKRDGTGLEREWVIGLGAVQGGLVTDGTFLYVVAPGFSGLLLTRLKLDGTKTTLYPQEIGSQATALAVAGGWLYWGGVSGLSRAKLDGTALEREWLPSVEEEMSGARVGVASDVTDLYWTETGHGAIGRVVFT